MSIPPDGSDPDAGPTGQPEPETIRVLLVDDDPLVRTGISMILSSAPEVAVVGSLDDGIGARSAVEELHPHVVLLDIRMTSMDGIAATREIRALPDPPAVVMLTAFDVDAYVIESIEAGASGFLLKDEEPTQIISAVRRVARGEPVLSPRSSTRLLAFVQAASQFSARAAAQSRLDALTEREREFAQAIARGLTNAEIAATLFCAVSTVKAVNRTIMIKLGLTNRVQIAVLAHQAGLV